MVVAPDYPPCARGSKESCVCSPGGGARAVGKAAAGSLPPWGGVLDYLPDWRYEKTLIPPSNPPERFFHAVYSADAQHTLCMDKGVRGAEESACVPAKEPWKVPGTMHNPYDFYRFLIFQGAVEQEILFKLA